MQAWLGYRLLRAVAPEIDKERSIHSVIGLILISVSQIGTPIVEVTVYLLYAFLAFAEVLVLFAVAIALFVFALRQLVKWIGSLIDAALSARSADAAGVRTPDPFRFAVQKNVRRIPGGHNEVF
jgi:hypothetical protein